MCAYNKKKAPAFNANLRVHACALDGRTVVVNKIKIYLIENKI
jgi:hypothetical protein